MCRWEGGGGARSLGFWPQGGEIPRDLAGGARSRGGGEIPGTPVYRDLVKILLGAKAAI